MSLQSLLSFWPSIPFLFNQPRHVNFGSLPFCHLWMGDQALTAPDELQFRG